MSNETVTYFLEAVLKEIKDSIKEVSQKFDNIDERLTKVEIGIADIKGDIKVLGSSLPFMLNQQTRCQDNILITQKFRKFLKP